MFRGISVFLHWTFFLLLAWIAYSAWGEYGQWEMVGREVLMVILVFTCVLMHEFGHALMAARYHVKTRDITLWPIGGVARLEYLPEKPVQELMIALAGPLVNLAIIAVLIPLIFLGKGWPVAFDPVEYYANGLLVNLVMVNLSLFLFNLLPAFPMDGGRILRAILGWRFNREKATTIAAYTGMFFAFCFIAFGVYANPVLALIGAFVFLSARGELQAVRSRRNAPTHHAALLVRSDFIQLQPEVTLKEALLRMADVQGVGVIIVEDSGRWAAITSDEIIQFLQSAGEGTILKNSPVVFSEGISPAASMEEVFEKIKTTGCQAIPVVEDQLCVGFITRNDVELVGGLSNKVS